MHQTATIHLTTSHEIGAERAFTALWHEQRTTRARRLQRRQVDLVLWLANATTWTYAFVCMSQSL